MPSVLEGEPFERQEHTSSLLGKKAQLSTQNNQQQKTWASFGLWMHFSLLPVIESMTVKSLWLLYCGIVTTLTWFIVCVCALV